ncbi:hypothetical protein VTO42DRAFT_5254 [Malbranchea cinnamomea]
MNSSHQFRRSCFDIYHDQTYTLRKFIGAEQSPQPSWDESTRATSGQRHPQCCHSSGNLAKPKVDSTALESSYLGNHWEVQPTVSHSGQESSRTADVGFFQPVRLTAGRPHDIAENGEQSNGVGSNSSWRRLDDAEIATLEANQLCMPHGSCIDPTNSSYTETHLENCGQLGLGSSSLVSREQFHASSQIRSLVSPASDSLISSFQGSDSGSPTTFTSQSFDNHSTVPGNLSQEMHCIKATELLHPVPSNSINSFSLIAPEWSEQSAHGMQNVEPIDGLYYGTAANMSPKVEDEIQEMVSLASSQERSSAPPLLANSTEWCTSEIAYHCPSLTTSFSSCGTPDTSLTPHSPSNEASYQYSNQNSDNSLAIVHTWADSSSLAGISSSSRDTKARSLHCSRGRLARKISSQRSESRDAFLVHCKRSGMSYKEIKEKGQFSEAESTLRGRFRTLTKRKEHRVRKPEWHENDLRLLCEAVSRYAEPPRRLSTTESKPLKVSWKLIGEYIWNNGGSYHFGNATCKKKWEELQQKHTEQSVDN